MKNILEELWYGNISPQEESWKSTPEMQEIMRKLKEKRAALQAVMPQEARVAEEAYMELYHEMTALYESYAFSRGFSLGVAFLLAALDG